MTEETQLAHFELWQRYLEAGDENARQLLVEQYLRVVRYVAGRMAVGLPHYVEYNDLVSAGLLGLIQAIDNIDHHRGIKFETYALPRIRGAILDDRRGDRARTGHRHQRSRRADQRGGAGLHHVARRRPVWR